MVFTIIIIAMMKNYDNYYNKNDYDNDNNKQQ